jgi:hypothetical protein
MDTRFQHLAHAHGHDVFLKVGSKIRPEIAAVFTATTPWWAGFAITFHTLAAPEKAPPGKTRKL